MALAPYMWMSVDRKLSKCEDECISVAACISLWKSVCGLWLYKDTLLKLAGKCIGACLSNTHGEYAYVGHAEYLIG